MVTPEEVVLSSLPSVRFNRLQWLPSVSCIYFCLLPDHTPVYIGETDNLRNRWAQHDKRIHCEDVGVWQVSWMEMPLTEIIDKQSRRYKRLEVERRFIQLYRPRFNWCFKDSKSLTFPTMKYPSKVLEAVLLFNGFNSDEYYLTQQGQVFSLDGDVLCNEGQEKTFQSQLEAALQIRPQKLGAFIRICHQLMNPDVPVEVEA